MKTVNVPDIKGPQGKCWTQSTDIARNLRLMARCNFPKGHDGPHQWEQPETVEDR